MTPSAHNRTGVVPLPADFIAVHLPRITSIVELKVSLHLYGLITAQTTRPRRVSWDTLLFDTVLQQSLLVVASSSAYSDVLSEGLAAAVQRGSFLHTVRLDQHGRAVNWYVVDTVENRRWADVQTDSVTAPVGEPAPDVLRLYEQHIGVVTPMLLAELRAAARLYPSHWFAEAMREAVVANVRSWRYVHKILQKWAKDGRDSHLREPALSADHYTEGAYGDLFRRGSDTSDL
jgi:DnaD/phage-associated family protein